MHKNIGTSQSIARLLLTKLVGVRGEGPEWMACCPAHDDSRPSLSITFGNNTKPLFHCHAGCSQERVLAALKKLGAWPGKKEEDESIRKTQSTS